MNFKDTGQKCRQLERYVSTRRLTEALVLLKQMHLEQGNTELLSDLENVELTYENLLRFNMNNSHDPEQGVIYEKLRTSILEAGDRIKYLAAVKGPEMTIFKDRENKYSKKLRQDEVNTILDRLGAFNTLQELPAGIRIDTSEEANSSEQKQIINDLFQRLLLTSKLNDSEMLLFNSLFHSDAISDYDKSILISALSLSLFHAFCPEKFILLSEVFMHAETQIMERALCGFIIALFIYEKRLAFYPSIIKALNKMHKNKLFKEHLLLLSLQLIKAGETEKEIKKIQEELLPEVMKAAPKLSDKLDIESILSEFDKEDKNPDWEEYLKDSPDLYKKMEEISNLQMEGSDVFAGPFSMLKHFAFFNKLQHWFVPFNPENEDLILAFEHNNIKDKIKEFTHELNKASFLCNSDKYSFCFNLNNMPESQVEMMLSLFSAEINSMNEILKEDQKLKKEQKSKYIYSQYLHDLYRFFKFYPQKNQFEDIFQTTYSVYKHELKDMLIPDHEFLRQLGEYYFTREHYQPAVDVFHILSQDDESNTELLQKRAYAYQKMIDYSTALLCYEKADFLDSGNAWTLKKAALCCRFLKQHEKALEYYLEAEKTEPDNLYIQAYIGHTYFDLKEYDKALSYYYKVEYLAPDNHKVLRPIAWISMVTGKIKDAESYFSKIPEKEKSSYDHINTGHLHWLQGDKMKAADCYLNAISFTKSESAFLFRTIKEDIENLSQFGLNFSDIHLMFDYLKMKLNVNNA